jgi:copper chaperone
MTTTVLTVEGMSCEHCVKAVEGAAGSLPGVKKVRVDLNGGKVTVEYEDAVSLAAIREAIEDQGYDVTA